MYITEVAIEGFKSYAQRVVLPNFDPEFNAITGLNGTGKSNILDSICFVLGIKNLSQVRATNLQELVYKQGQAGITKASVSITFRNDNPRSGPSGYEDKKDITVTRTIVIGGRNKYTVNGVAVQENKVQDMFHSVQLNVNNPHFLIMQGRINKVCNMKPVEIMSLLEEASGTRMYEKKKEKAKLTMEKKEEKLQEIESVLSKELRPTVEKLRSQCKEYHEHTELGSKKERLKRFLVAFDYTESRRIGAQGQVEVQTLEATVAERQQLRQQRVADEAEKKSQIKDLQTEKEIQSGGEVRELQGAVDKLNLDLTRAKTDAKNKKENLAADEKALKQLQAAMREVVEGDAVGKLAVATVARDEAKAAVEAAEGAVEAATREVAGAEAGDGRDGSNRSLQERLADAQNAQTAAGAETKAAEVKARLLSQQLADMRKSAKARGKEEAEAAAKLSKARAEVDRCSAALQALSFDEAALRALEAERERLEPAVRACRDEADRLGQQAAGCAFNFRDPRPGFDRSKVHGVVASLVHVKDPSTSTALEVAAGGKLYQVVVEDELTAKELLERGQLTKRVTIIPLNKIQAHGMSASTLAAAKRLGGDRVQPALALVGCAAQVERAMQYVFGSALICQDAGTAKKLAFAREVHQRCVTLQGDDFNPSGLLTGGSRSQQGGVLTRLHELAAAEEKLHQLRAELQEVDRKLAGMSGAAKEHRRLTQQLDLQRHALELLQDRIAGGEPAQLAAAAEQLQGQVDAAQAEATEARVRVSTASETAAQLEREIKDFSRDRTKRLSGAKERLKSAKSELEAGRKLLRKREQALQEAAAEAEAAESEGGELVRKVAEAETAIAALRLELQGLSAAVDSIAAEVATASAALETKRARMHECDSEISSLETERQAAAKEIQAIDAEVKKLEGRIKSKGEEVRRCLDHAAKLEEMNQWVLAERDGFGRGDYDFVAVKPEKVHKEYTQAEERWEQLKGKVNHKCIDKLERAERECQGLMEKYQIVENDKKSLKLVIEELDNKAKSAMHQAWKKVDEQFRKIFSTLLPGASAKLEEPEGLTYLDGLEMRVEFGGVWKESLTELSGGQRSLLALSLILALCKFHPAPLYILDEVDSALDINNSQNIGHMIKEHFPSSQFIVVSHKDGFFNNANIIYRTKFVDGVSAVTRTVVQHADRVASGAVMGGQEKGKVAGARGPARQVLRESNR